MTESRSSADRLAAAVQVNQVVKVFGHGTSAFTALDDVSLTIRSNEFFTLLGPSGCGKTTLLRLIAGFEYPTAGSIQLDGADIARQPPYRRPVNTVFQNYALFPHMTVADNIAFGLEMLGRPRDEIDARVRDVLALVRMSELRNRATSSLSGGQQQRVALARALAPSPRVLLLDEPLSALDYKLRKEMQIELKRMQTETGITFIFVTHDQEEALTMSDRIAVMSSGKLLQVGTPHDIYERPSSRFVASFIGETNFIEGHLTSLDDDGKLAAVTLTNGVRVVAERADDAPEHGQCTLVIRPEHLSLIPMPQNQAVTNALVGTVHNIVYSGTDTHYHIRLSDGSSLIVRRQNARQRVATGLSDHASGEQVIVECPPGSARVLVDSTSMATADDAHSAT